ncbi:MAG: hypothetical protein QJR03_03060 [Sphaerobacter sp.]|nr:hypothetical protein [Sphaerobacter sp.]
MVESRAHGAIAGTAVFLAALLAALLGMLLVVPFGFAVPEGIVWLLAVGFGALTAALAGGWVANGVAPGGTRSRFYAVVGATEVGAAVVALTTAILHFTPVGWFVPDLFSLVVLAAAALALIVNAVVWRSRAERSILRRDLAVTAGLLALGILLVASGMTATCTVTTCTA